jgi:NAD dependent epimerase/dehydratase family enzyme
VQMVRWVLVTEAASGPLNLAVPNPVTNAEFSRAVGLALHRPSWLPAPAFALRLLLGDMADELLLCSQRLVPARALELGYRFRFASLDAALADILQA